MSKFEELIAELCPEGVENKELGEILTIKNGRDYKSLGNGSIPVYGSGGIMTYVDSFVFNKPSVLIPRKGSIDKLYYVETPFWNVDTIFYTEINTDFAVPKYIYYCLQREHLEELNTAGGVPSLTQKVLNKVTIPVPPLQVQSEIVRILDNFKQLTTELTIELTKELTARKKQYKYYRDDMLKFDDKVKKMKLGDFATISRGGNFQKKDFCEKGVPCIHYGQIYTRYGLYANNTFTKITSEVAEKSKFAKKNDVIMAVTSENIEDVCKCVAWLGNEDIAVSGHTAIIHHNQNPKYLSHYFHTTMFDSQKRKLAHGTKVIEVTPSKLADIEIPIPTLEEQENIVKILDKFNTLCNDITTGLPAEIDARKKQYEYYRDKLLTFKELS
jgi:type I restriction enzyme S subunit